MAAQLAGTLRGAEQEEKKNQSDRRRPGEREKSPKSAASAASWQVYCVPGVREADVGVGAGVPR